MPSSKFVNCLYVRYVSACYRAYGIRGCITTCFIFNKSQIIQRDRYLILCGIMYMNNNIIPLYNFVFSVYIESKLSYD